MAPNYDDSLLTPPPSTSSSSLRPLWTSALLRSTLPSSTSSSLNDDGCDCDGIDDGSSRCHYHRSVAVVRMQVAGHRWSMAAELVLSLFSARSATTSCRPPRRCCHGWLKALLSWRLMAWPPSPLGWQQIHGASAQNDNKVNLNAICLFQ